MKHYYLLLLMTVMFAACQADPYKSPQGIRPDPLGTSAIPQQIVIEGLGQAIVSSKPIVNHPADGRTLHVTVPVRNITDQPLNVQYRFEFFDKQGRTLRSNGGWVFQHIEPTLTAQLTSVALETKAVNWSVVVRPAH